MYYILYEHQSIFHQPKTAVHVFSTYTYYSSHQTTFWALPFSQQNARKYFPAPAAKQQAPHALYTLRNVCTACRTTAWWLPPVHPLSYLSVVRCCGGYHGTVIVSRQHSMFTLCYIRLYIQSYILGPRRFDGNVALRMFVRRSTTLPPYYSAWCLSCFDMYNTSWIILPALAYNTIHANWRHILLLGVL